MDHDGGKGPAGYLHHKSTQPFMKERSSLFWKDADSRQVKITKIAVLLAFCVIRVNSHFP